MRTHLALAACVLVAAVPVAWAAGGAPMPSMPTPREQSPQDQAKSVYNDGIRDVRKADGFQADANQLSDAGKKDKALRKAHDHYASSQTKFLQAVKLDPKGVLARLHSRNSGEHNDVWYCRSVQFRGVRARQSGRCPSDGPLHRAPRAGR